MATPFQCGGAVITLTDIKVGEAVNIRIESGAFQVVFTTDGTDPSATNAQGYLNGGEAVSLSGLSLQSAAKVKILNITGNPKIYVRIS